MVSQRHDVLVEPEGNGKNKQVSVSVHLRIHMCSYVYVTTYLEGLV